MANQELKPPEEGGKGGDTFLTPNLVPTQQTSDTRLFERAIRERWNIPEEFRTRGPAEMGKILRARKNCSRRNKIAAFRALIQADAQNLEAQKIALQLGSNTTPTAPVQGPAVTVIAGIDLQVVVGGKTVQAVPQVPQGNGEQNGTHTP